jgi:hypothetical protein
VLESIVAMSAIFSSSLKKGTISWIGVPTDDPACELADLLLGCSSMFAKASCLPDPLKVFALGSLIHAMRLASSGI